MLCWLLLLSLLGCAPVQPKQVPVEVPSLPTYIDPNSGQTVSGVVVLSEQALRHSQIRNIDSGDRSALNLESFRLESIDDPACLDFAMMASALGDRAVLSILPDCLAHISGKKDLKAALRHLGLVIGGYRCNSESLDELVLNVSQDSPRFLIAEAVFQGSLRLALTQRSNGRLPAGIVQAVAALSRQLNAAELALIEHRVASELPAFQNCLQ